MDRPKNTSSEGSARCQMIKEEGNGLEAGGPTPAGASVHRSAGNVEPIEGGIYIGSDQGRNMSIHSRKERITTMLDVLHSHGCVDFGAARPFGGPAGGCGIRSQTWHLDDKLGGYHGNSASTVGILLCRSP